MRQPRRHLRLRRGVLRRSPRRDRARGPGRLPRHGARVRPLGRHRRARQGPADHQRRARLRGDEPAAAAADPAAAVPRARRRCCRISAPKAPDPDELSARVTTWWSPPTASTRARGPGARGLVLPGSADARQCKYMWLSTDLVFDAFKFYIPQTPYGVVCRYTATPTTPPAAPSSWRCTTSVFGGRPGSAGEAARDLAPASRTRSPSRGDPRAVRRCAGRAMRCRPTTPGGSASPRSAARAGGTATSCCSGTPRTPRTFPSGQAPSWRWRMRWRSPRAYTSSRAPTRRWPPMSRNEGPWWHRPSGAAQASLEWFENTRPVPAPGTRAVPRSTSLPAAAG